jgi:1-acyl-sn-glycerol-3-phosphate acyltransferase
MIYCLKLLLIGFITLPLSLLVVLLGLFDRSGRVAYAIGRLWTWTILKTGRIRLKVRGLDRLDPGRPYVFIVNHQSNLDIPVLVQSLPKFQLRWIAKKQLAYVPFFGWALWASRHILVDRVDRGSAMASFRKAKEKIAGGDSVVIFPEGTRGSGGRLLPFKRGGFLLAVQTKTSIVPVTINGSWAILPRGDWRVKAGEIEVIVDEPIPVDQYHGKNVSALVDRVRDMMESHSRSRVHPYVKYSELAPARAAEDTLEPGIKT